MRRSPGIKKPGTVLLSHEVALRSIIGAGELNFRVRDGNGCGLSAISTRKGNYTLSTRRVKGVKRGFLLF